ncbi:MAG: tetratricopeptide repeat protein [Leptospiraceae bacterium]|nr:tetratricopeptide repeat protein [Leptospiraceae bacterium]MCP5496578.1 tetratricopeptide repeat protein [Leptospiraceae bacterium]
MKKLLLMIVLFGYGDVYAADEGVVTFVRGKVSHIQNGKAVTLGKGQKVSFDFVVKTEKASSVHINANGKEIVIPPENQVNLREASERNAETNNLLSVLGKRKGGIDPTGQTSVIGVRLGKKEYAKMKGRTALWDLFEKKQYAELINQGGQPKKTGSEYALFGLSYFELGDYEKAEEWLSKALDNYETRFESKTRIDLRTKLGVAYFYLWKYKDCFEALSKLEKDKLSEEAKFMVERSKARSKE